MSRSNITEKFQNNSITIIILFLLIWTLIVYSRGINNDFINLDDPSYVLENPHVVTGLNLENVQWAFTSTEKANWHPLTWISHMADAQLYGISPKGHHFTSILLHAVNTALLFLLLYRLTAAYWRSAFVAALFAAHPLHVESVAWVAERKDVLSTLFFLLVLLAYTRFVERPGAWRYAVTLTLFACGLMAKPMLVTLPCILILLDYWPLKRYPAKVPFSRLVVEKVPFFLLSAISAVITLHAQKEGGAVASIDLLPLGTRIANALLAYGSYIGKTFWPTGLVALYPMPGHMPVWHAAGAALFLGAVTAFAWLKRRSMPFIPVGWFWFLGTLVPVIGLVQVGGQAMADRYTYIPHIGLFILIVWSSVEFAGRMRLSKKFLGVLMAGVIAVLSALSWMQVAYWRNGITLFRHALEFTERNVLAQYHMGVALTERGRLEEAIRHYSQALEIEPGFALAHFGLGCNYMQRGETDKAVNEYEKAIQLEPGSAKVLYNLGLALFAQGKIEEAIARYSEALRMTPMDDNVHNNLGIALVKLGRTDEGVAHFSEALRINPRNEYARMNLRSYGLSPLSQPFSHKEVYPLPLGEGARRAGEGRRD
jgi:tetratricopeptide (TPR) repeat protein